jgi:hypothetical protein
MALSCGRSVFRASADSTGEGASRHRHRHNLLEDFMTDTKTICAHTHVGREYMFGLHTGDRKCSQCGQTWAPGETIER